MARPTEHSHWKGNKLLCTACLKYWEVGDFTTNPQRRMDREGRHCVCKVCQSIQAKERRKRLHKDSLDKLLKERLNSIKTRCKEKGWSTDITLQYLKELLIEQDSCCAISGIKMTHLLSAGRVPTNLSIDRIDSSVGYTRGNVHFVCMAVNQMKSNLSMDLLIYFCKQIINNYEG